MADRPITHLEVSKPRWVTDGSDLPPKLLKSRERLQSEPRASKGWWSRTRRLLQQKGKMCSVPALKRSDGTWCRDAKSKVDHLANSFKSKYKMTEAETHEYSEIEEVTYREQREPQAVREKLVLKSLKNLKADSATGPDGISTIFIRHLFSRLQSVFLFHCLIVFFNHHSLNELSFKILKTH